MPKLVQPELGALPSTSTWAFNRAADLWEDSLRRIRPTIGRVSGGDEPSFLLYDAALNMLFGGSGTAKTWIALTISAQLLRQGRSVIFLDYEGTGRSITDRLRSIGVTKEQSERFIYVSCLGRFDDAEQAALGDVVESERPALLIIDTAGASVGTQGGKNNDDHDIIQWRTLLPLAMAQRGLCVLELDHTGVSAEAQTRVAGGHRKRGGLTGIQLQAEPYGKDHPHGRGRLGKTKLICRKDREGTYPEGTLVAIFTHEDDSEGLNGRVGLWLPSEAEQEVSACRGPASTPRHVTIAKLIAEHGLADKPLRTIVEHLGALPKPVSVGKDTVGKAKAWLKAHTDEEADQ